MRSKFSRLSLIIIPLACFAGLVACHTAFGIYHTVRKGETLYSISRTYDVPVSTLKDVNYLRDAGRIHPGEELFIPGASKPKKVATQYPYKGKPGTKKEGNTRKTAGLSASPKQRINLIWPVDGVLTSGFGPRKGSVHTGIDISAPVGTPVIASTGGRVIYADNKLHGYGNLVAIEHKDGYFTLYGHMQVILVHKGDTIRQGQQLGRVGTTGRSSGPHLHFEVRYHKKAIDPLPLLP